MSAISSTVIVFAKSAGISEISCFLISSMSDFLKVRVRASAPLRVMESASSLTLRPLATVPLFAVVLGPLTTRIQGRIAVWRQTVAATTEDVQETLSAIGEVKAQNAEEFERQEFDHTIAKQYDALCGYNRVNVLSGQVNRSLAELIPVLVLAVGAWYIRRHPNLDAPAIVTLYTAVPTLLGLVASISGVRLAYVSGVASARSAATWLG